jgi:hypothetical protein
MRAKATRRLMACCVLPKNYAGEVFGDYPLECSGGNYDMLYFSGIEVFFPKANAKLLPFCSPAWRIRT